MGAVKQSKERVVWSGSLGLEWLCYVVAYFMVLGVVLKWRNDGEVGVL